MPTVVRERGFRVMIFYNDHPPAHVHVLKDGKKTRVYLDPVALWDSNMKPNDAALAVEIVQQNRDTLLSKWSELHETEDENGDPAQ